MPYKISFENLDLEETSLILEILKQDYIIKIQMLKLDAIVKNEPTEWYDKHLEWYDEIIKKMKVDLI